MPIHFYKLGQLFKQRAVIQKERTPAWAIALGLALYAQGLTLAQLGVRVSHVAVWYWIQSFADNWPLWNGLLPERIVVDETQVKLGDAPAGSGRPSTLPLARSSTCASVAIGP